MNLTPPPLPRNISRFAFEPMADGVSPIAIIEALLKAPGRLIYQLQNSWRPGLVGWLLIVGLLGMTVYGCVVGTFSGGDQLWIAPAKVAIGTTLSVLICLPSLYIFVCLAGMDAQIRVVMGVMFAAIGLTALLLIGFAPVAWIFSQSTDSVAFIGALHIGLWIISVAFGLRLLDAMSRYLTGSNRQLKIWAMIFVAVCLQMMTTLRPIIGRSDRFLPAEKKFFLSHWSETVFGRAVDKKEGRKRATDGN